MISIFLVITLLSANGVMKVQRLPMASPEECVRRGTNLGAVAASELTPGQTLSVACEFQRR